VRRTSWSVAGLPLAIVSAASFGTSGSFGASLIATGWTPLAAVTVRVVVAASLLTIPALLQLPGRRVSPRSARTVLLYGVAAVAGAQLCYFNAVAHLSVAVALLLEYSGILLVVGWGWARHGQRPHRRTFVGTVIALVGLVLVLDLVGSHHVDTAGVLWGFGAAVGLAVYFVIAAAETDDALPPLVMAWGGLAIGAIVLSVATGIGLLPVHAGRADVTLVHHHVSWLVPVLGMSVVAGVVAFLTGVAAARMLGAKLASFVGLTEVLFAVLFAWLMLGQRLELVQILGGAVVVAGIALVRLDEMSTNDAGEITPVVPAARTTLGDRDGQPGERAEPTQDATVA
jgi:drug/metabolite transporter (DMT)-like permease